jgi:hypothetical protein
MNKEQARIDFLRWLSRADPQIFALSVGRAEDKAAMGDYDENLSGWVDTLVSSVAAVGGALLAKKQSDANIKAQKAQLAAESAAAEAARADQLRLALIQTNTERALRGLPPVDINGNVIPGAQLPQIPQTQLAANSSGGQAVQYLPAPGIFEQVPVWAWIAGAGVLTVLLVRR